MRSYNETIISITGPEHAEQIRTLAKGFHWIIKRNDLFSVYTFSAAQQKRLQFFLDKKKQHTRPILFSTLFNAKTRQPGNTTATDSFS